MVAIRICKLNQESGMKKRAQEHKSTRAQAPILSGCTCALVTCALVFLLAGCAANPITGEDEMMFSGDYRQDIELGKQIAPEVEKALKGKIPDEGIQGYIDGVGRKITEVSHNPNFDFHFVAVNDKSINAVSLPGGYIFITKGMLLKLKNESQLAGVLAHETVHVVARDAQNMMSKETGLGVLFVLALSQTKTQGEMAAVDLARQIVELKYSREDERTADVGGMDYMVRAGYNPNGIVEAMRMLEEEETKGPAEFLSTHPSPENRVSYLQARIQTYYSGSIEGARVGQDDYQRSVLDKLEKLPDAAGRTP
jgi:predicted Zn-dependent protease